MIKAAAREQLPVRHPENPAIAGITIAQLSGPPADPQNHRRNAVVVSTGTLDWGRPSTWTGVLDRSPCGTGTSAKMATLHARGQLAFGRALPARRRVGDGVHGAAPRGDVRRALSRGRFRNLRACLGDRPRQLRGRCRRPVSPTGSRWAISGVTANPCVAQSMLLVGGPRCVPRTSEPCTPNGPRTRNQEPSTRNPFRWASERNAGVDVRAPAARAAVGDVHLHANQAGRGRTGRARAVLEAVLRRTRPVVPHRTAVDEHVHAKRATRSGR